MEIFCMRHGDKDFPALLRETPWVPERLYIKGSLPGGTAVAIVGTRKASEYGKSAARSFARELARRGVPVISGLAFGVDAAAHRGALAGGGQTLAVLANGLDTVYPRTHESLAAEILQSGGGLLSEYPPATPPLEFRFLERNRIIAGLAAATLIIEAPRRSGALATARYAAEAGRDVFVFPGRGGDGSYAGSHALIREGAVLVDSPEDLLSDLNLAPAGPPEPPETAGAAEIVRIVLTSSRIPLGVDEIIEATTLSSSEVNRSLAFLEVRGLVKEEAGRYTLL